jgi:hypothetical protein
MSEFLGYLKDIVQLFFEVVQILRDLIIFKYLTKFVDVPDCPRPGDLYFTYEFDYFDGWPTPVEKKEYILLITRVDLSDNNLSLDVHYYFPEDNQHQSTTLMTFRSELKLGNVKKI